MEITTRTMGKCKVLDCSGSLIIGRATEALRKAIREAVQDDTSKVILNLKDVPSTDTAGRAEMISGWVHAKNQGSELVLLNLTKKVQTQFANMKILCLPNIYDDEQKALEGCE